MVTVIASTNRPNSISRKVAEQYYQLLLKKNSESQLLCLDELPPDFLATDLYGQRSDRVKKIIDRCIEPASRFVFIVPEYNGGFPGVIKAFIDCMSPKLWHSKRAAMVGISAGHTGTLLGMDHLTGVLHYLKVEVMSNKPKLSQIEKRMDGTYIIEEDTIQRLEKHIDQFLQF